MTAPLPGPNITIQLWEDGEGLWWWRAEAESDHWGEGTCPTRREAARTAAHYAQIHLAGFWDTAAELLEVNQ